MDVDAWPVGLGVVSSERASMTAGAFFPRERAMLIPKLHMTRLDLPAVGFDLPVSAPTTPRSSPQAPCSPRIDPGKCCNADVLGAKEPGRPCGDEDDLDEYEPDVYEPDIAGVVEELSATDVNAIVAGDPSRHSWTPSWPDIAGVVEELVVVAAASPWLRQLHEENTRWEARARQSSWIRPGVELYPDAPSLPRHRGFEKEFTSV